MATTPNLTDEQMTAQFLAFCRSKPADKRYEYGNTAGCAFAQFVRANGYPKADVGGWSWWPEGEKRRTAISLKIPPVIPDPLVQLPYTFGALADRLAALMAEPVQ